MIEEIITDFKEAMERRLRKPWYKCLLSDILDQDEIDCYLRRKRDPNVPRKHMGVRGKAPAPYFRADRKGK